MLSWRWLILLVTFYSLPRCIFAQAAPPAVPSELKAYIDRPEPDYAWKKVDVIETPQGKVYNLTLVSQKWQGIIWDHALQVVVPKDTKPQATMLIWNQGASPRLARHCLLCKSPNVSKPLSLFFSASPSNRFITAKRKTR